ncbi:MULTISPECIES: hypothetical protein [unclassified Burkholderia]|nr:MULTISPECIES: hypothetical protein [unclassified Burkholderia]
MNFGLLLSNLPQLVQPRLYDDAMPMLDARPRVFSRLFTRVKSLLC